MLALQLAASQPASTLSKDVYDVGAGLAWSWLEANACAGPSAIGCMMMGNGQEKWSQFLHVNAVNDPGSTHSECDGVLRDAHAPK